MLKTQGYISQNSPAYPVVEGPGSIGTNFGLPVRLELAGRFLAAYLGGDHFDKAGDPAKAIENALWWADHLVQAHNKSI